MYNLYDEMGFASSDTERFSYIRGLICLLFSRLSPGLIFVSLSVIVISFARTAGFEDNISLTKVALLFPSSYSEV